MDQIGKLDIATTLNILAVCSALAFIGAIVMGLM